MDWIGNPIQRWQSNSPPKWISNPNPIQKRIGFFDFFKSTIQSYQPLRWPWICYWIYKAKSLQKACVIVSKIKVLCALIKSYQVQRSLVIIPRFCRAKIKWIGGPTINWRFFTMTPCNLGPSKPRTIIPVERLSVERLTGLYCTMVFI